MLETCLLWLRQHITVWAVLQNYLCYCTALAAQDFCHNVQKFHCIIQFALAFSFPFAKIQLAQRHKTKQTEKPEPQFDLGSQ